MTIIMEKSGRSPVTHEHPGHDVARTLQPYHGPGAGEWCYAARTHAQRAGGGVHRDHSAEHALICVNEPEKAEPAVAPLFDRLALAEAS